MLTRFAASTVKTGHVVWDVGANVGLFTFSAAGLAGPDGTVVAVEADTWLAGNLRRAAYWNPGAASIVVVPAAVADEMGLNEFVVAKNNRAVNYLSNAHGSDVTGGVRERQIVPTLTLDCLAKTLPLPDVLKIDVEGAEVLVLAGAKTVLDARPTILIETGERTKMLVHAALSEYGYRYLDAATLQPCAVPVFNTIAVPN